MNIHRALIIMGTLLALGTPSLAQSFVDFEFVPGGAPVDGLMISNQFQASLGISFIMENGTFPQLAQVGPPKTAFNVFGGPDLPAPGVDVGQFFLTDDGVVGSPPPPLLVNYATPVQAATGVIIDIDFTEQWTIEARDALANVLATQVLTSGGNGSVTPFNFDAGMPLISQIRIAYTGALTNNIGLAFDNFLTISPGAGTGQPNSADARLEINRQGATGAGPFGVQVGGGSTLELQWSGPAGQPVILIAGPVNAGNAVIPCFGSLDLGMAVGFTDIEIVFDGTVFPQSLFLTLDPFGQLSQSSVIPASASGSSIGLQGAVIQPIGAPCSVVLTAAFEVSIF